MEGASAMDRDDLDVTSSGSDLDESHLDMAASEPGGADSAERGVCEERGLPRAGGPPLTAILEALLMASDAPVPLSRLAEVCGAGAIEVRLALAELNDAYVSTGRSFRVEEIARGYQLLTQPAYQSWIAQLNKHHMHTRLTDAALETLAIVAYRQPITRTDVEAIRGVAAGDGLNRLREMGLVKIVGRAEIVGRPMLYGTTRKFLETFGLGDLKDLPPLEALMLRPRPAQTSEPVEVRAALAGA